MLHSLRAGKMFLTKRKEKLLRCGRTPSKKSQLYHLICQIHSRFSLPGSSVFDRDSSFCEQVDTMMKIQTRLPDIFYCVAGGTATLCGFMTDITAADLDTCMKNDCYTSAYMSQWVLKAWTQDDGAATEGARPKPRQIVFISSMAAFIGLSGYTSYTRKSV